MQRHERLEQDIKVALSSIITYEVKEPEVSGICLLYTSDAADD